METHLDCVFDQDEADFTMVSYVLLAASCGQSVIRVLSDDTDVFVPLVDWGYRAKLQCKVQMERWDSTVLNINATCDDLGPTCLQLQVLMLSVDATHNIISIRQMQDKCIEHTIRRGFS